METNGLNQPKPAVADLNQSLAPQGGALPGAGTQSAETLPLAGPRAAKAAMQAIPEWNLETTDISNSDILQAGARSTKSGKDLIEHLKWLSKAASQPHLLFLARLDDPDVVSFVLNELQSPKKESLFGGPFLRLAALEALQLKGLLNDEKVLLTAIDQLNRSGHHEAIAGFLNSHIDGTGINQKMANVFFKCVDTLPPFSPVSRSSADILVRYLKNTKDETVVDALIGEVDTRVKTHRNPASFPLGLILMLARVDNPKVTKYYEDLLTGKPDFQRTLKTSTLWAGFNVVGFSSLFALGQVPAWLAATGFSALTVLGIGCGLLYAHFSKQVMGGVIAHLLKALGEEEKFSPSVAKLLKKTQVIVFPKNSESSAAREVR